MTLEIRRLGQGLIGLLIVGSGIAWGTVILAFKRFYEYEGTLFKIQDCVFPNPVMTPCFYGAVAFLVALIWAIKLYRKLASGEELVSYRGLMRLLFAATIFGAVNVAYEIYLFSVSPKGITGCGASIITSPWQSSCTYGSIVFLLSLIVTVMIMKRLKQK
jgi:hypothetical protein